MLKTNKANGLNLNFFKKNSKNLLIVNFKILNSYKKFNYEEKDSDKEN